jgi:diguanylate cyclase (GGDEF)-like protein
MKIDSDRETPQTVRAKVLTQVLEQSEHVNGLLEQSAEELSCVTTGIKHELANSGSLPGVETAHVQIEAVRGKVQDASEKLTAVNQALSDEVRERNMVDHQLAAAMEQEEGARNAALHDVLTGLPNRALFNDRLEHGIAQARRHSRILAVMFVDLDEFKTINDTYGHQAGDAVLRTIANRLKHNTREDDTVSRFGGDEFLYLLTQINAEKDIAKIAVKILNAIQAPCNVSVDDVNVNPCLAASIGISIFPKDGVTASALIKSADQAMYGAKENKSGYAFAQ